MPRLQPWCRRSRYPAAAIAIAIASLIAAPATAQTNLADTQVLQGTVNHGGRTWNVELTARYSADSSAPFKLTVNDTLVALDSSGTGAAEVPGGGPKFIVRHPSSGALAIICPNDTDNYTDPLGMTGSAPSSWVALTCNATTSVFSPDGGSKWNAFALRVWLQNPLMPRVKQMGSILEGIQEKLQSRPPAQSDSTQQMAAEFKIGTKLTEVNETLKQILLELDTAP